MRIDGIILAAGLSKRFGQPKQLINWRGKPLILHVAETALASQLRSVILVIGHAAAQVRQALKPVAENPRLKIVLNPEYEEGQATSIRRGLRGLDKDAQAAMFLTCDQPLLSPPFIDALIESFAEHRPLICYPAHRLVRGSPTIFAAELFPELMKLTGDVGGRVLIEKYRVRVLEHKIASRTPLTDIDTEEDLERLSEPQRPQSALKKRVTVVCDGSSLNDQQGKRRAAAAAILSYKGKSKIVGEYLGSATNQQAEIVGACIGLEALKEPCRVQLISDSVYLILTMKGTYKRKANHEFWARLDRAAAPHQVEWVWTRGHAGHQLQQKCDKAARRIAKAGKVDEEKLAKILAKN